MLKRKLDAAVADLMPLALAGDFDGAEQRIRTVDCDVYGFLAVELANQTNEIARARRNRSNKS